MTRAQNKDPLWGAENVAHVADRRAQVFFRAHRKEDCSLPRRDSRTMFDVAETTGQEVLGRNEPVVKVIDLFRDLRRQRITVVPRITGMRRTVLSWCVCQELTHRQHSKAISPTRYTKLAILVGHGPHGTS